MHNLNVYEIDFSFTFLICLSFLCSNFRQNLGKKDFFFLEKSVSDKTFYSPCLQTGEGEKSRCFWVTQQVLAII